MINSNYLGGVQKPTTYAGTKQNYSGRMTPKKAVGQHNLSGAKSLNQYLGRRARARTNVGLYLNPRLPGAR